MGPAIRAARFVRRVRREDRDGQDAGRHRRSCTRGVVRRDLKLENLVLAAPDGLSTVTLVDFEAGQGSDGARRPRGERVRHAGVRRARGAPPDGTAGRGCLGVAMHVLLTGTWPFDSEDEDELMDAIIASTWTLTRRTRFEAFSWISPDAKDLLRGLLEPTPSTGSPPRRRRTPGSPARRKTSARSCGTCTRAWTRSPAPSRQHPERRFRSRSAARRRRRRRREVFVVTSGESATRSRARKRGALAKPGELLKVGTRRKANLVGEIPALFADGERNAAAGDAGRAAVALTVRATTETRALVFSRADAVWAVGHDRLTMSSRRRCASGGACWPRRRGWPSAPSARRRRACPPRRPAGRAPSRGSRTGARPSRFFIAESDRTYKRSGYTNTVRPHSIGSLLCTNGSTILA